MVKMLRAPKRRFGAAAVALLALLAAAPAGAATVTRLHARLEGAPVWSGSRALVVVEAGQGSELRTVDPYTGASKRVAELPHTWGRTQLSASASLTALQGVTVGCEPGCKYENYYLEADDLLAAVPGGSFGCVASLARMAGCRRAAPCPAVPAAALVSASRLAYQVCEGTRDEPRERGTAVLDFASSPRSSTAFSQIALPLAFAGPWLVGLAAGWSRVVLASEPVPPPTLIERNILTGAEPVRIQLPFVKFSPVLLEPGEYPAIAAVQEEGQLVYVTHEAKGSVLWRASPTEPTPIQVAQIGKANPATGQQQVPEPRLELRGGRIALLETKREISGPSPDAKLRLMTLDGSTIGETVIPGEFSPGSGFDFDGSSVVLGRSPCWAESFLASWSVGEAAPVLPRSPCPLVSVPRRAIRYGRHAISLEVRCPAHPPLGCPSVEVIVTAGRRGDGPILRRDSYRDMRPGETSRLSFPVGPRLRTFVRRHRKSRATVLVLQEATYSDQRVLETAVRPSF